MVLEWMQTNSKCLTILRLNFLTLESNTNLVGCGIKMPWSQPGGGLFKAYDVRISGLERGAWHIADSSCQCFVWIMPEWERSPTQLSRVWTGGESFAGEQHHWQLCWVQSVRGKVWALTGAAVFGSSMDWVWGNQRSCTWADCRAQQRLQCGWGLHGRWWKAMNAENNHIIIDTNQG